MTQTLNSNPNTTKCVKFLYSYNGQILPRPSDGLLRYIGGHTRVLSVDRSISFAELMVKFGELTGTSMRLKCKLPNEDLDVLITIKSDEELQNMIDEYNRVSELTHQEMKIRAVLLPVESLKKISPPSSPMSCIDFHTQSRFKPKKNAPTSHSPSPPSSPVLFPQFQPTRMALGSYHQYPQNAAAYSCCWPPAAVGCPAAVLKDAGRGRCCPHGSPRQQYFVPYSNNYCK